MSPLRQRLLRQQNTFGAAGFASEMEVGRATASCVCTTNLRFFVHTILPKGGVPPPVGYPLRWRFHGIEPFQHQRTTGRSITTWGASALPQDPMARVEISALPLGTPIDQMGISWPLWTPSITPLKPTVRWLDTATVLPADDDRQKPLGAMVKRLLA